MYSSESIHDPLSDPRIAALMATIHSSTDLPKRTESQAELQHPPETFQDFLEEEKIDEWPQRLTSEGKLDFSDIDLKSWEKSNLLKIIKDSVPLEDDLFSNVEVAVNDYEAKLIAFADHIVSYEQLPSRFREKLFHAPKQEFLDNVASSDAIMLHYSTKNKVFDVRQTMAEQMQALRSQNVEYATFPGFRDGELTELPSQLEAPQLLNKVSQAQDFSKGFNIFWKKIFFSEGATALLQDTVWWLFLEHFECETSAQERFYTRIASTYVSLFMSVHPDFSDKFFRIFPRCFAQCVYLTFREAFPESKERLSEQFVTDVYGTISEWMTGVKPPVDDWKTWPWEKLCSPPHDMQTTSSRRDSTKSQGRKVAEYIRELQSELDAVIPAQTSDSFAVRDADAEIRSLAPTQASKKIPVLVESERSHRVGRESVRIAGKSILSATPTVDRVGGQSTIASNAAVGDTAQSAQSGPGPDFERVMFNLAGRSPLVSHYLHMLQLQHNQSVEKKMRRTEIAQYPSPAPTFQEIINHSRKIVGNLQARREKMITITEEERQRQEKLRKEIALQTNKMKSELSDPVEIKMKSDRVLDIALGGGLHRPSSYATTRPDTVDLDSLLLEDPKNLPDPNSLI